MTILEIGGLRLTRYNKTMRIVKSRKARGTAMMMILPEVESSLKRALRFCILIILLWINSLIVLFCRFGRRNKRI